MALGTKNTKIQKIIFITILIAFLSTACAGHSGPKTVNNFMFDTVVSITYYNDSDLPAVNEALNLGRELESVFSRTLPESELYRLNESGSMTVSAPLLEVIELALHFSELTEGCFDPTMGAVSALYNFSSDAPALPAPDDLRENLTHVGWENITVRGSTVTLGDPEAVLDLGAVAKGYAADRMKALLAERGVAHAIINLGGNILCLGGRPDGKDFAIGVQYPSRESTEIVETVHLSDLSVVTSGVYQRFFENNGEIFHHILDPQTGMSVRNGLSSVTVIGPSSAVCDALSTACFALGLEAGTDLVESFEGYCALFITDNLALHASAGFPDLIADH